MNLHGGRAWARLGACTAAAIVAAGFAGFTSVAYAASGAPDLSVKVPGASITLDSAGKFVRVDIANLGTAAATHVQVALGFADSKAVTATPVKADGCTAGTDGKVCDIGTLNPGESLSNTGFLVALNVNPTARVAVGSVVHLTVSVSEAEKDANPKDNTVTVPLTVAPAGVDMIAFADDVRNVAPGATADLNWSVADMGGVSVSDFTVNIAVPDYVAIQDNSLCTVAPDRRTAKCQGEPLSPSDGPVHLVPPMTVTVARNAPGPVSLGFGEVSVAGVAATSSGPKAMARTKRYGLTTNTNGLKSGVNDSVPGDNTVQFAVTTTANAADLEVTATPVSGGVGSTVQVPVTVRDNGPVDVQDAKLHITAPSGTQVVDADVLKFCTAVKKGVEYWCNGGGLQAGQPQSLTIAFKITSANVGSDGRLVISGPQPDPVKANNTAKIVITVGEAAGLPITGTKTGLIGGIGGGLLIVGVTLWLINRRRRVILVTPRDGG